MTLSNEDLFWAEDGIHEQIGCQITDYLYKNRDVCDGYYNHVIFSAYPCDGDNAYTNNLLEVAIEGRIMFKTLHQDFFGGMAIAERNDYVSKVLENPTWLDLCLCANDMINCTGDTHHIFLEDVYKTGSFTLDDKSFILIYDFSMGS